MTGKQRFVTALKGGTPDGVPIFDFLDSNLFIERVIGWKPEAYNAQDVIEATLAYGLEGALILASDSDIRNEMPYEDVDLMFKTALRYGTYPLDLEAVDEALLDCRAAQDDRGPGEAR
jgi:hypothetical protein